MKNERDFLHEIANCLAVGTLSVDMAEERLMEGAETKDALPLVQGTVKSLAKLIRLIEQRRSELNGHEGTEVSSAVG